MTGRVDPKLSNGAHAARERALASLDSLDDASVGLVNLPPTAIQIKSALAVGAGILMAVAVVAPFAATPLPRFAAFIPFLNATILVTDLVTAILLFAQFSISRSRGVLVLAGGYLFTALIVIPHALTFPGAFSPTGLLGAGVQTTAWLYILWHLVFPLALLTYAALEDSKFTVRGSIRSAIAYCVGITVSLALGIVWITTAGDPFLPRLFVNASELTPLGTYIPTFDLLICVIALAFLWLRRRSVLGLWLMVVACALIGELAITVVRFSLGFYVSRVLSVATSAIVLVILLSETTGLYMHLARTNQMLRRERDNKLMNIEAVVASISHEVKQPLATIVMRSSTALRFLGHAPPDLEKARSALKKIVNDGHRASQIFDNIRDLFRANDQTRVPVNVNKMILGVLDMLQGELAEHHVATRTELMPEPTLVMGHQGQLQEVLLNLIRNAIEAMDETKVDVRELRLSTASRDHDGAIISVLDTGPGIDPERLSSIFDAFVTTKPRGMGLGLAICRMIVERHGGRLVASSGDKGGALFQLVLPIAPDADEFSDRGSPAAQD
ncbi:MAG TPA: MASE4 domain-containing protein [Bradyrhizobium sp.]|nr:MASE4 domain-containing protein [Bradyrhizobium sp.]